ncbi:helicase-related protein [Flavobacterium sp.]|uniref:helicase-related protein n=1 Tax=Flavobacterium sp. TaxID=239 RepID=UPI002B4B2D62|nr:helicase-related protein [Flavobacterium sp.]HLF52569.1 helicase-related protein [Flavobacterium sp.]
MDIRDEILKVVEKEIVGPCPNQNYLDEGTGEEILLASVHGSPKSRYGAGMLYPQQAENNGTVDSEDTTNDSVEDEGQLDNSEIEKNKSSGYNSGEENDEEPVGMANQYLPSAMGFTVRFKSNEINDEIWLKINSAHYEKGKDKKPKKEVDKEGNVVYSKKRDGNTFDSDYWIRRPIKPEMFSLNLNSLFINNEKSYNKVLKENSKGENWLILRIFNRTTAEDKAGNMLTVTFVLINALSASTDDASNSNNILFQNELILSTENKSLIEPYKERILASDTDEEKELNLLYRKKRVFSIGHGTSVRWDAEENTHGRETVKEIRTSVIPVYDLPQVAPTSHVSLSMLELSDLGNWELAKESLKSLKKEYELWIEGFDDLANKSSELENYREAAKSNVEKCKVSLHRISKGIDFLINAEEDSDLVKCFTWMNRAMIWQQQRSKAKIRKWSKTGTGSGQKLVLDYLDGVKQTNNFESLEDFHKGKYNGKWRPFQLAFILMNIESIIDSKSKERKIVDLIWFPTGGGKTEAYLGLTAFNIFYRRMKGKKDSNWDFYGGTTVLMRYTLRLLTTQQYERAASLICACDLIRIENKQLRESKLEFGELGDEPISIGLWVGGTSTPNKNDEARAQLSTLNKDSRAEYNFVVMKCPCCGTQIGKVDNVTGYDKVLRVKGLYKEDGKNGKVYFQCENTYCEYSKKPLPLQVIDELIYENPPTLLLGTVDKFAMIPWKPDAGKLFGFRKGDSSNQNRICPPELIIQDELHLIAGPLGTMVGLYEAMVQTLCNNYNKTIPPFISLENKEFIVPKIVASSATISRAYEQVKNLYSIQNRNELSIFPAQGLEFGNTWFSEEKSLDDLDEEGNQLYPGRKYVGILASGYPSAQTSIVRTYAMVLQKIKELSQTIEPKTIDYYWTLLGYFNSIRELGGASSLVHGDIKERLGQIQSRDLITKDHKRFINRIEELTSRISSSEIPATLKKLETKLNSSNNTALDICLATNMVATGVDISRLGLMFIHGQPKTTAEYIQASSRVGRDVPSGPGLIFTLYSPSKPRDKSQYEQFQGYHSRIYSNVEPTSVTPFSINARQKGLHAILIALVRHFSAGTLTYTPIISDEFYELSAIIEQLIKERCEIIDPEEVNNTMKLLSKRIESWKKGGAENYGDAYNSGILKQEGFYPLMYATSAEVREEVRVRQTPFATSTSMRGVDTESVLCINSNNDQDE